MGKLSFNICQALILLLNLAILDVSQACPYCLYPTPPSNPHPHPPHKSPPKLNPHPHPHPPHKPPSKPNPPHKSPRPPHHTPKPPSHAPNPPKVSPPIVTPTPPIIVIPPPITPTPPIVNPPPIIPTPPVEPPDVPCPPPPKAQNTCPIDTLKLNACVDVLGGLVHIGVGSAKDTCCPVLGGLVGLDAAICLCTTIKAKLLNINIVIPLALQLLIDCGKTPPPGFQCAA